MKSKSLFVAAMASVVAFLGVGAAFAGSNAPPVGATYVAGPGKVVDPLNHTVITVPKGWYAAVPRIGTAGVTTLTNYDAGSARLVGAGGNHVLLKEMAKIDVLTLDLRDAATLQGWMEKRYSGNWGADVPVSTSRKVVLQIGDNLGMASVVHLGLSSAVEIVMPFSKGKVLLANIAPVDTVDLEGALAVVDRVRRDGASSPAKHLSKSDLARLTESLRGLIDHEIHQAGSLEEMENVAAAAGACNSWIGTDNGDCGTGMSCASTAGITLYMPFQVGTYWMAGGVGSFYGNYYHGNCNLDYYAIDFNQYAASNCTNAANEIGQNVYAMASGTATKGTYSATGYGYNVLVAHSNSYSTRAAHLSSISITNGQAVTGNVTVIGLAGDSGSAAGLPHVHISYQVTSGKYSYCNKSGGCPNGEAAKSPQTRRPSPEQTAAGSSAMVDGGCFQGPP